MRRLTDLAGPGKDSRPWVRRLFTGRPSTGQVVIGRWWVLMALVIGGNFLWLGRDRLGPWARAMWYARNLPALERGARIGFGLSFARFIGFLRATIPEDATVVLPRPEVDDEFGHDGIMGFFLFPREIINCPSSQLLEETACIQSLDGESTYFLGTPDFPPLPAALEVKEFLPFDGLWGVYVPR